MRQTITRSVTRERAVERIEFVYDSPAQERLSVAAARLLDGVGLLAHGLAWGLRLSAAIALWTCARAATGVLALEASAGGGPRQLALMDGNETRRLMP